MPSWLGFTLSGVLAKSGGAVGGNTPPPYLVVAVASPRTKMPDC